MIPPAMTVTTPSNRELAITRVFDAPRSLVFDAFTKPDLVRRWLTGPDGWSFAVCEIDARTGGKYRYVWRRAGVPDMGMGGEFLDVVPPERYVATERFDDAWYPGSATVTTTMIEQGRTTVVTMTIRYDSQEARDMAVKTGMETGIAASYNRLDGILASLAPGSAEAR
jgi:uncharacterized protein YndB with AHSA1/START domain